MGEVWAGEHRATGMRVALKMLLPEMSTNAEMIQRFKREAVLLGRVRSDRVARMIDFLFDPRCGAVLVTEFVEGSSLADAERPALTSVEGAVELGIEIACALRELHRAHIVHRDMKPGNVIIQPIEDGRSRAVIVDLGVSRHVPAEAEEGAEALTDITRTQIVLGTMGYIAPEQILEPREVTASADIYGLGAILFRMVAGTHVFAGMSQLDQMRAKLQGEAPRLRTGRPDALARGFEAIVSRALQREPRLRYASADEMIAALSALRDDVKSSHRAHAWAQGRRLFGRGLLTAAISLVLAVLAAIGFACQVSTAPPSPSGQVATPAPGAARAGMAGDGLEPAAAQAMCTAPETPPEVVLPPSRDLRAEPRPPSEGRPRTQRERDAALMRAIRRAVQDEAYMTLTLPSNDEIAAGLADQVGTPGAALTFAGR